MMRVSNVFYVFIITIFECERIQNKTNSITKFESHCSVFAKTFELNNVLLWLIRTASERVIKPCHEINGNSFSD